MPPDVLRAVLGGGGIPQVNVLGAVRNEEVAVFGQANVGDGLGAQYVEGGKGGAAGSDEGV